MILEGINGARKEEKDRDLRIGSRSKRSATKTVNSSSRFSKRLQSFQGNSIPISVTAIKRDTSSGVTKLRHCDSKEYRVHPNAVKGVDNAMPCHRRAAYDRHNLRTPATRIHYVRTSTVPLANGGS